MYALSLIYLEVTFQWMVFGRAHGGCYTVLCLGFQLAVVSAIMSGLGPRWLNKAESRCSFGVLGVLFVTQRFYYDIFKTFLSFFSITNGTGNAVEFSEIIMDSLGKIWWQVLAAFAAGDCLFCVVVLGRTPVFSDQNGWRTNLIMAAGSSRGIWRGRHMSLW